MTFTEWLQNSIDEKGITLKELARNVGVTEVTMSRYHTGKRIPNIRTTVSIAKALGIYSLDVNNFYVEENTGREDTH